jgi:tetratricopeptide (TPR) repeat protein
MYIRAFLPDQLVHDRYAYLPSLGVLMILVSVVHRVVQRPKGLVFVGLIASALLLIPTIDYNRAWHNDFNLWQRAAETDPTSATNLATYGLELRRAGKIDDAKVYLHRALEVFEGHTTAQYNLALIANDEGDAFEAERRLRFLVDGLPEPFEDAINQLGKLYAEQGRFNEAISVFDQARMDLPFRRAKYTVYIAVAHFQAGRRQEAFSELESIIQLLEQETDPTVVEGWFFLADLYRHAGRMEEARAAAEEYLKRTKDLPAEQARLRKSAQAISQATSGQ